MTKVTMQTQGERVIMQLFPLSPEAIRVLRANTDEPAIKIVVSHSKEHEGHSRLVRPA